jgi:pimeloyl-ACP methyl ester carboxylesterase
MTTRTAMVRGKQVVYWELNASRPRTLVMLHGFRGDRQGLIDVAYSLSSFRLLIPDLPGCGESEALSDRHTTANYVDWLEEFLNVIGQDTFGIWAHSYGGTIALQYAAKAIRRPTVVVAVAPVVALPGLLSAVPTVYYSIVRLLPRRWHRAWIASHTMDRVVGQVLMKTRSGRERKALLNRGRRSLATLNPHVVVEQYSSLRHHEQQDNVEAIAIPVLIVAGGKDIVAPIRLLQELAARILDCQIVTMPGLGHLAPLEDPDSAARITKGFIDRRWIQDTRPSDVRKGSPQAEIERKQAGGPQL